MEGVTMKPARPPSVLIIGAGVAGLASAIRLAKHGFNVRVFEKNNNPGGRLDQIEREGFTFDTGPTLYVMPNLYTSELERLGIHAHAALDLQRVDPTYHLYFEDGNQLVLTSDLKRLGGQIERFEPGASKRLLSYLAEGGRHYDLALNHLVQRDFRRATDFFNVRNLPLLFQVKALQPHYPYISRYFDDPHLKAAFTFQDMYMGLSPFEAPTTFSLMQYSELAHGVWYPRGGMYRIVKTLVQHAVSADVEIHLNSPVMQIDVKGNRAAGLTLENGELVTGDYVIANADLPYVYGQLLPQDGTMQRLQRKRYSCSTISFFWGLNNIVPELEPHMLFLADDYEGGFQALNGGPLPDRPSLYVHTPTRLDPSLAPQGRDSVIGIVPVGNLNSHPDQDWQAVREKARQAIFQRLESLGIDSFSERIQFETCFTPCSWRKRYNLYQGATHGLSHTLTQLAYMRPHNQHKRYRNLYFVGASTHPGTGVPTVLVSARLAAERIIDLERQ
jgi:phytoene desaturase